MANASLKNFKLEDFTNHSGEDSDSSEDDQETKVEACEPPVVKTEHESESKPFDLSHIVKTELTYNHDDDSDDKEKDEDWMMKKAFSCPFCKATFNKANNMKSHIKRIHTTYKPEDCHCEACDKNFKNPDCLKSHIKEFHTPGIDRTPQLCTHCGKSFNKKSNLKVHILNSHTKYDPVDCICSQCGKMFKNPLSMKRHVETFHDEERKAEMIVVCPDCGKQFNKRTNLKIHMECVHTTYEPGEFICTICSKELKNPHSLKSHMREVHTVKDDSKEQVVHKCDECDKEFKKKKDLRGHKYAAHKIDVKMCEFCFNEYKNQTALKQHLRLVHGPEQQVSCEICFKTFKNITRLKHHHIDVHRIENSACPDCGKSFKNKFLMKKHLRYLHRGPNGARVKQPKSALPKSESAGYHPDTEPKIRRPKKSRVGLDENETLNLSKASFNSLTLGKLVQDQDCNKSSFTNSSQDVKSEKDQNPSDDSARHVPHHDVGLSESQDLVDRPNWHHDLTERLAPKINQHHAPIYNHVAGSESEHNSEHLSKTDDKAPSNYNQEDRSKASLGANDVHERSHSIQHPNPKYLWKQYEAERAATAMSADIRQSGSLHIKQDNYENSRIQEATSVNHHQQGFVSPMMQSTAERLNWNNAHSDRPQESKLFDRQALNLSHCERTKSEQKPSERSTYSESQGLGQSMDQNSSFDKSMWGQNIGSRQSVDYSPANNPILDYRYRERSLMDHNPMAYFNQMQQESLGLNLIQNDRAMSNHDPNRRSVIDQMQSERSMFDHLQNARSVFEQMQMQNGRSALDQLLNSRQGIETFQHMQNGRSLWDHTGQNRR